jgi:hypothetical protein
MTCQNPGLMLYTLLQETLTGCAYSRFHGIGRAATKKNVSRSVKTMSYRLTLQKNQENCAANRSM